MRCLGILFVGFALSAGNQTPKDKQEQPPSIVGKWKVVGMILNAREQPPEAFDQLIYVITTEEWRQYGKDLSNPPKDILLSAEKLRINESASPSQIDVLLQNKKVIHGIYRRSGSSHMLFFDNSGDRPVDFVSKNGAHTELYLLERIEDKKGK